MKHILRTHLVIALASLLTLLVGLFALYRFASAMNSKQARVIEARDRLASFEQNRRIFESEANELDVIKARIGELETNVVTAESVPVLLSSLESMAKARSVDFSLTQVENVAATEEEAAHLHIDFSADGSFVGLEQLVDDMLSRPYQVKFSKFSLYVQDNAAVDTQGKSMVRTVWQLLAGIDIQSS